MATNAGFGDSMGNLENARLPKFPAAKYSQPQHLTSQPMKTQTNLRSRNPQRPRSVFSIRGSVAAAMAALSLLSSSFNAAAQWDNWDDGDDFNPPVEWTHVDPIYGLSGGASVPNTYDASGGNYHLTADFSSSTLGLGKARTIALATNDAKYFYSDFYVSVDVVAWSASTVQAFGLLGRVSTPGPATTSAYGFGLATGVSGQNYIQILRFENESTKPVLGSGPLGNATMPIADLDPAKSYRMVFMARGPNLEGRLYDLSNLNTPIALVQGNTTGDSTILTNGSCGLLAFGLATGAAADVTFDNYYASKRVPLLITDMAVKDNFNDGNDTAPATDWTHYDPIFLAGQGVLQPQNSWSFPNGGYELKAEPSPDPQFGPARVGSIDANTTLTNFRIAVDLISYDPNVNYSMSLGFLARAHDIGPGMTDAHAFTFQTSSGLQDVALIRIHDESPSGPGAEQLKLDAQDSIRGIDPSTNQFRLVFVGQGNKLRGLLFKLPETMNPLLDCEAVDNNQPAYTAGPAALFGFNYGGGYAGVDVTFDNYSDTPISAPAVSVSVGAAPTGEVMITWPANNQGVWVLQSSSNIDPAAVWTQVLPTAGAAAAGKILYDPVTGKNTYMGAAPMSSMGTKFYRLQQM